MTKSCHCLRVFLSQVTHHPSLQRRALGQHVTALREKKSCMCVGGQVRSVLLGLNKSDKLAPPSELVMKLYVLHKAEDVVSLI